METKYMKLAKLLIFAIFPLFAFPTMAQGAHSAAITWTNSVDTPNTNVYRNVGACPTTGLVGFTKLTAAPVTTAAFTDSTPIVGVSCYALTAVANGLESVPVYLPVSLPPSPPSGATVVAK